MSISLTLLLRRVKLGKVFTTPPSTITVYPVKYDAAGDAKNKAHVAISSLLPTLCNGIKL